MVVRLGDPLPSECEPVTNLVPRLLGLSSGNLIEVSGTGVTSRGKLFLTSRKSNYISVFGANGIIICDTQFCLANKLLSLLIKGGILGAYGWYNDPGFASDLFADHFKADTTLDWTITYPDISGVNAQGIGTQYTDGKLLTSGIDSSNLFILRFNKDGSLDNTWGGSGKVNLVLDDPVSDVSMLTGIRQKSDNSGIIGCLVFDTGVPEGFRNSLYTLNPTGSSQSHVKAQPIIGETNTFGGTAFCILSDGSFVFDQFGPRVQPKLQKCDSAGNYITSINVSRTNLDSTSAVGQTDGKIIYVSAMRSPNQFVVNRYHSDLSLDFSTIIPLSSRFPTIDVAVTSDGKIFITAFSIARTTILYCRLNSDGTIDTSFGSSGVLTGAVVLGSFSNIFIAAQVA